MRDSRNSYQEVPKEVVPVQVVPNNRSLGAKKTIHNFGIIVIIVKLDIQSTTIYGMKIVRRPVHLAKTIPLQKIQWVAKRGFTSHLN